MTTTATPDAQWMSALATANHVRYTNAQTCDDLRALPYADGCRAVARLLRHGDMDGPLGSLPIWRLLKAIRWMGDARAGRVMVIMGAESARAPRRTVRRLTVRQRHLIARALEQQT